MKDFNCEKCNKVHDGKFGSGKFCSKSCANSRIRSKETIEKISISVKNSTYFKEKLYLEKNRISGPTVRIIQIEKLLNANWDSLGRQSKKTRILIEQNHKCLICNLDSWMGKVLKLDMDHIDGNHNNSTRENLRCICPNCHSQTPTWKKSNKPKFS